MRQGFFTNLPSEITIDILSRLPARTIVQCKCVCKSWLDLIETHQFANHHVSKSLPGLAVLLLEFQAEFLKIYEFKDELELQRHEFHYNPVTAFSLPVRGCVQGSANGLLLLRDHRTGADPLYICNPITRDCIQIDCPREFAYAYPQKVSFGFGTSRASCAPLVYNCNSIGAFFNGNLHWFVTDLHDSPWISCFDLETEDFCSFPSPPGNGRLLMDTFALEDCLCVCDNSSYDEIVIWVMEEYGVEKSWTKKFVISKIGDFAGECYENVRPIKVFKDGDILMAWGDFSLFYYPNKTKTLKGIDMFQPYSAGATFSIPYTSSFLSLRSFTLENVSTF